MKRSTIKGLSCVAAFLLSVFISTTAIGNYYEGYINGALGIQTGSTSGLDKNSYRYLSDYTDDGIPSESGFKKMIEAEDAFNKTAEEESAVLVYNNGALPLNAGVKKVTLLGRSTVDPVYRCTSAGPTIDQSRVIELTDDKKAAERFNVSPTSNLV